MATQHESLLPSIHDDRRDIATGQPFPGCGGTLVHRQTAMVCSACESEVWRLCTVCGFWYDWADWPIHTS